MGEDLVSPDMAKIKKALFALDSRGRNFPYSTEEIANYNLGTPALRNLYAPRVSFYAQPETVLEAISDGYGPDCQPSINNDYCGVHYQSGIPNRAVSLIISKLGLEKTRNMIFRTNTMRLTAGADFQEYARQMYVECMSEDELSQSADCPVVLESFKRVGVAYPDGVPVPTPAPGPTPGPQPIPGPQPAPRSPVLMFCGWISIPLAHGNITVIDNKFDAAILVTANYQVSTSGDFSDIYNWKGGVVADPRNPGNHPCGCVWGRLSQTTNAHNTIFNYFSTIAQVKVETPQACINDHLNFK
jgi:hypothetical protein